MGMQGIKMPRDTGGGGCPLRIGVENLTNYAGLYLWTELHCYLLNMSAVAGGAAWVLAERHDHCSDCSLGTERWKQHAAGGGRREETWSDRRWHRSQGMNVWMNE